MGCYSACNFIFSIRYFNCFIDCLGFSCTYFRYRKVLVESQALVTGAFKGRDYLNWPCTLTMAIKFVAAFGDLITDILFAFVEENLTPPVFILTKVFLGLQAFVQLLALFASVQKVRRQLGARGSRRGMTWLGYLRKMLFRREAKYCIFTIFFPIIALVYLIVVSIISIILGLTKLMAVKQVQQWWLGLVVYQYNTGNGSQRLLAANVNKEDELDANEKENEDEKEQERQGIDKQKASELEFTNLIDVFGASADNWAKNAHGNGNNFKNGKAKITYEYGGYSDNDNNDNGDDDDDSESQPDAISGGDFSMSGINQYSNQNEYMANSYVNTQIQYMQMFQKLRAQQRNIEKAIEMSRHKENEKEEEMDMDMKLNHRVKEENKHKHKHIQKNMNQERGCCGRKQMEYRLGKKVKADMSIMMRINLFIDQFTPDFVERYHINCSIYNSYMMSEVIIESLPQLICMYLSLLLVVFIVVQIFV